jgi:hypothetical protein
MMKRVITLSTVFGIALIGGCAGFDLSGLLGGGEVDLSGIDPKEYNGGTSTGTGPHLERGGRVVVEAEHYTSTSADSTDSVSWYMQDGAQTGPGPDPDGYHPGASGDNYVELLPDRRVHEGDSFANGSFNDDGDDNASSLSYDINFVTTGKYYVWGRIHQTGTEDNGLHVGVDGVFPDSGKKMQWCANGFWAWANAKRDSGGGSCGRNGTISVDIATTGVHTVMFRHREDGLELDRFVMTTDSSYKPLVSGPVESPRTNP